MGSKPLSLLERFCKQGLAKYNTERCKFMPRGYSTDASTSYTVWAWGRGTDGATGSGTDDHSHLPLQTGISWNSSSVPRIYAGMWHSGATVNGSAYLWGKGKGGRLGSGDEATRFSPAHLACDGVESLSLGGQHTAAITKEAQVFTWGYGGFGCLGHAEFDRQLEPKLVRSTYCDDALDQSAFQDVVNRVPLFSAGGSHSLVVDQGGRLFSCGRDEGEGRLGITHPMLASDRLINFFLQVPLEQQVVGIAAGGFASFALTKEGDVMAWGGNGNGELGGGSWGWSGRKARPIHKLAKHNIQQLSAGGFHAAALSENGEVYTWGMGRDGALGNGGTSSMSTPARVDALRGQRVVKVCCGPTSTFAVMEDGRLFAWGNNASNSLGVGGIHADAKKIVVPTLVCGIPPVLDVAAGAMHGFVITQS